MNTIRKQHKFLYVLLVIDNVSEHGRLRVLHPKTAIEEVNAFRSVESESRGKTNLKETDDGKEFANQTFREPLSKQNSNVL